MDNVELDGRSLRVNKSQPKGSGPSGPSGGPPSGPFNAQGLEVVKLYVGNLSFEVSSLDLLEGIRTVQ